METKEDRLIRQFTELIDFGLELLRKNPNDKELKDIIESIRLDLSKYQKSLFHSFKIFKIDNFLKTKNK